MGKIKLIEIVLLAISALITASRSIIKFIGFIDKIKKHRASTT